MSEKQPIGIELPKETIEALLNGACKFIVPMPSGFRGIVCDPKDMEEAKKSLIASMSKLQIGDEFYIQEQFSYNNFYEDMVDIHYSDTRTARSLKYTDGYGILDKIRSDHKCTADEAKQVEFSASQMTLELSRIKGKILGIEAGGVWDLSISDCRQLTEREEPNLPYLQSLICDAYRLNCKENSSIFLYTVELQA